MEALELLHFSHAAEKGTIRGERETYLNFIMSTHPSHNAIYHRADNLGGIVQILVDAQLNIAGSQKQTCASQACYAGFRRNTGTCATLAKHDRDRFVLETLNDGAFTRAELLSRTFGKSERASAKSGFKLDGGLKDRAI